MDHARPNVIKRPLIRLLVLHKRDADLIKTKNLKGLLEAEAATYTRTERSFTNDPKWSKPQPVVFARLRVSRAVQICEFFLKKLPLATETQNIWRFRKSGLFTEL